jgi:alginate O-acetyltransferase complex protein AlgI
MIFSSINYLVFFVLIFSLYWAIPSRRFRVWLLLGASFYFYASWNKWLAFLICVTSTLDYLVGIGLDASRSRHARRTLLFVSVASNLGLLIYFKYANFFLESFQHAFQAFGISRSLPVLEVILPVGISFYTFEAINYTVDVYRRKTKAETSLPNFLLFITFFPHLVAGPIVRASDFLPQIRRDKHWDWARLRLGLEFFAMGLVKKLVIADRMALYADPVFSQPELYSSATIWLAVIAYAIQIYCDFSGYTDMALGSAHMLGYKLAQNFNMPYIATNISEFWRRWHISLSSWLRDYLFIPLGGSRGTEWQTSRNLMLTMILGGLWHGASWTFVIWGVFHGLLLVVHRGFRRFAETCPPVKALVATKPAAVCCGVLTFVCVCIGWVFFRSQTLAAASVMLKRMLLPQGGDDLPLDAFPLLATIEFVILCHAAVATGFWKKLLGRTTPPAWGLGYSLTVAVVIAQATLLGSQNPFIYFQF